MPTNLVGPGPIPEFGWGERHAAAELMRSESTDRCVTLFPEEVDAMADLILAPTTNNAYKLAALICQNAGS
jgi:hypothetical protein